MLKKGIISAFVGIILGVITELALIFYWRNIAVITQDFMFWFLVYLVGILFSKNIKESIINNSIIMTFMSISYYIVRICYSGKYNIDTIIYWCIFGIVGAIACSIIFKLPKKGRYISIVMYIISSIFTVKYYMIERKERTTTVTDYVKKFNYDSYIILSIVFIAICIISIVKLIRDINSDKIKKQEEVKNND